MDIGKFIDEYVKASSQQKKDSLIKKHVVATYIPYETKMAESVNIVNASCYVTVDDKKRFVMNTPLRYSLFMKEVIMLYTDLEFDTTNFMIQFNLLLQYNILSKIIMVIGKDYEEFQSVMNMTIEDTLQNERSIVSYFETITDGFAKTFNEMYKGLEGEIQKYMADLIAASSETEFTES